ncbi:IclR family transcriptional regulator [Phycicoccus sp. CSK15P-2]|uniref:IclR family transcriptional regulator n=1 Tax=Phycicoccus sp. CSK15P-2 TaxID=2807627 RepID=UPI00194E33AB|nr:IclR family transcriptional regulator [Phycicoccus sp. CSK15P-2]MBM6403020.1 IclR family transcriptional regulator [Phycicoccus sp. CSK15P-2]
MTRPVQSVLRAASLVTLLAGAGRPLDLVEISAAVELPKSTVHGLLATLRSAGWVEQDRSTSRYRVSHRLDGLARSVDPADLRSAATPWMDRLAAETGLEVQLAWPDRDEAVIVQHVYRPDNSPQRLRVGEGLPLHATALGKVLLAHARPGRPVLPDRLETFTRFTLSSHDDLAAESTRILRDGYAVESGEYFPDITAIAVPVRDALGDLVAALATLGSRDEVLERGDAAKEVLTCLVRAAGFVSRAMAMLP